MTDEKRVKSKLAELCSPGPLTKRENFYEYRRRKEQIRQAERRNPHAFRDITSGVVGWLDELERRLDSAEVIEFGPPKKRRKM